MNTARNGGRGSGNGNEDHVNGDSADKQRNGDGISSSSGSHRPTHQHSTTADKDDNAHDPHRPYVCLLILQHSKDILEVLERDGHC